jgi:hypothetical protein
MVKCISRNDIGNWQRNVHVLYSVFLPVFLLNEVTSVGRHVAYSVQLSFQNFPVLYHVFIFIRFLASQHLLPFFFFLNILVL